MAESTGQSVDIVDLGRVSYTKAYRIQCESRDALSRARTASVHHDDSEEPQDSTAGMRVFLLEHDPPVITVSRRPGATAHLLASPTRLAQLGIEVVETDRGGDITYHGPGQIVAYAILDLKRLGFGVSEYVRWLEGIVIQVLRRYGVEGVRDCAAPGVWVASPNQSTPQAKVCAVGVRISRWITMHGLALNVRTDLSHFETIVPCGLTDRRVTSMAELLGPQQCPDLQTIKRALREEFINAISTRLSDVSESSAHTSKPCSTEQMDG